MRKLAIVLVALALAYFGVERARQPPGSPDAGSFGDAPSRPAPESDSPASSRSSDAEPRPNTQFEAAGVVEKVLPDDRQGSQHQRFIVRLASGRSVLIAHNIDLAPRVANLRAGDSISFSGEFENNDKGGVVHWTHHDPAGRHVGGWIRHQGQTYQ